MDANDKTKACYRLWEPGFDVRSQSDTGRICPVSYLEIELPDVPDRTVTLEDGMRLVSGLDRFDHTNDSRGHLYYGLCPDDTRKATYIVVWGTYGHQKFLAEAGPLSADRLNSTLSPIKARITAVFDWIISPKPLFSNSIKRHLEIVRIHIPITSYEMDQEKLKACLNGLQYFGNVCLQWRESHGYAGDLCNFSLAWVDQDQVKQEDLGTLFVLFQWRSWERAESFKDPDQPSIGIDHVTLNNDLWQQLVEINLSGFRDLGCRISAHRTEMKYLRPRQKGTETDLTCTETAHKATASEGNQIGKIGAKETETG